MGRVTEITSTVESVAQTGIQDRGELIGDIWTVVSE